MLCGPCTCILFWYFCPSGTSAPAAGYKRPSYLHSTVCCVALAGLAAREGFEYGTAYMYDGRRVMVIVDRRVLADDWIVHAVTQYSVCKEASVGIRDGYDFVMTCIPDTGT